jgi:hypothetical protein
MEVSSAHLGWNAKCLATHSFALWMVCGENGRVSAAALLGVAQEPLPACATSSRRLNMVVKRLRAKSERSRNAWTGLVQLTVSLMNGTNGESAVLSVVQVRSSARVERRFLLSMEERSVKELIWKLLSAKTNLAQLSVKWVPGRKRVIAHSHAALVSRNGSA